MKTFKTSNWQPRGSLMLGKVKYKSPLVYALQSFVLHSAVDGRFMILWNVFEGFSKLLQDQQQGGKFLPTNTHKIKPL